MIFYQTTAHCEATSISGWMVLFHQKPAASLFNTSMLPTRPTLSSFFLPVLVVLESILKQVGVSPLSSIL